MELDKALIQLFPDIKFPLEVELRDIGEGSFIARWGRPELQPTLVELEAAWQAWLLGEPTREAERQEIIQAPITARQWFIDNPATSQLFDLSVADLENEINTLVDAIIPLATAGNRTRVKKLWMIFALHVRIYAKERGWI